MDDREKKTTLLKTLSPAEMRIAWWICKGLKDNQISLRVHIQPGTLNTQKSDVFKNLELTKYPRDQRRYALIAEYRDLIFALIPDENALNAYRPDPKIPIIDLKEPKAEPKVEESPKEEEKLEVVEEKPKEEIKEPPEEAPEPPKEESKDVYPYIDGIDPEPEPNHIKAPEEDGKDPLEKLPKQQKEPIEEPKEEKKESVEKETWLDKAGKYYWYVVVGTAVILLICIGIGIYYNYTSPPVHKEDEYLSLAEAVHFHLEPGFDRNCLDMDPVWGISFVTENRTIDDFNLEFHKSAIHVADDLGNTYQVTGMCQADNIFNEQEDVQVTLPSAVSFDVVILFGGKLDPRAKYLTITFDNVSGVGPLVFKKGL